MTTVSTLIAGSKSNILSIGKPCIALAALITLLTIYYFGKSNTVSNASWKAIVSSTTPTSEAQIAFSQCSLSMRESDNWFCESDLAWKRRKVIHYKQYKRNRISDTRPLFFQNNWEPTFQCEFEQRVGNTGDGGKWVCDIYRYEQMNDTNLLIYSFGSNGDFSFERAIKEHLSKAEIHTFDMGVYQCPPDICKFHQARLGNGKDPTSKSLQMIMAELGHQKRQIHILKVDIEGSEYDLFEDFFKSASNNQTDLPYIRQILFEIHLGGDKTEEPSRRTHRLFELFHSNSYVIFHKEANLYDAQNVFEYAMLRLNSSFFVSPL